VSCVQRCSSVFVAAAATALSELPRVLVAADALPKALRPFT